jgi:mono/diheme cytochrome c family protein
VREIGQQILRPLPPIGMPDLGGGPSFTAAQRRLLQPGQAAYKELCFSCHGTDGKGAPMAGAPEGTLLAPPLAGSARVAGHRDYVISVLLAGLTGPVDGKSYSGGVMAPMGANTDEWVAGVASFVRNGFGNSGTFITPAQVAAVRAANARRRTPWTLADLEPSIPKLLTNAAEWKVTASHNADAAATLLSAPGAPAWNTGAAQQPGMWFAIELPQPVAIAEVQFDSAAPGGGRGGRGGAGGGRGAPPAAPGGRGAPGAPGPAAGGGRGRGPAAAGPVSYTVQVSTDGTTWGAPVGQGTGETPTTTVTFKPVQAKVIRINQTGAASAGEPWAIQQIRIYSPGSAAAGR